jgi:hypothetical protein
MNVLPPPSKSRVCQTYYQQAENSRAFMLFNLEDGGSTFLQNISTLLPHYRESYSKDNILQN